MLFFRPTSMLSLYIYISVYIKYVYQKWLSFRQTLKGINIFKSTLLYTLLISCLCLIIVKQVFIMYSFLKSTVKTGF